MTAASDLILRNGKFTTLDRSNPQASAVAIRDGKFVAVGDDAEVMRLRGATTKVLDLGGRCTIPGLIDSHIHIIRGGLNYNMELRWDGVESLAVALEMLKVQVARTPAPQWVRVVGGFTEQQFAEKRLPSLDEINAIAPHTPVFILHLYDRALLNAAALRVCGYTKETPDPPGGFIARGRGGEPTGLLLAKPNATILYATLAKGPKLPLEYQVNSTRHFMRELNRLGLTSAIDAGGGSQSYPDDYEVVQRLAADDQLTVRIAYNLFTQKPKAEKDDFLRWTQAAKYAQGDDYFRLNGAGEMLVFSAADFEDFREPRPELPESMEAELEGVIRVLASNRWPFRMHATYDETISRALAVFERVDSDIPLAGIHWFFDHAETVTEHNLERIARLGGGVAVQHRMAYQGDYFVDRYGAGAAAQTPPIKTMFAMGLPLSAGTDATRVASYNPWICIAWLVTGKTVSGTRLYPVSNCLDRTMALRLWTEKSPWFSNEEGKKGRICAGQLADLAVLNQDYFNCPEESIRDTTAVLTVLGGKIVYGAEEFVDAAPPLPPALPDWAPPKHFGGHPTRLGATKKYAPLCACDSRCGVHGHSHMDAWGRGVPASDARGFWGALGCSCFAF